MTERTAKEIVNELVEKGKQAMEQIKDYDQVQANQLVQAVAWAIYQEDHAKTLAEISVKDTGLGRYEDKVTKNQRKTFGTLRDLMDPEAKSVGIIAVDEEKGITEIAKPVGVVAAVCPSTNPAATPANKAMMALKCKNAIILAPSPKGATSCVKLLEYIYAEFDKIGAPRDLVQMLSMPVSKELTFELIDQADFVTVTGSGKNVQRAQTSGTVNACVGAGNVVSMIDATADIHRTVEKITKSKIFDYSTSCSSDNAIVIEESVYDEVLAEFERQGAYLCTAEEKVMMHKAMWDEETGKRRGATTAKSAEIMALEAGLDNERAKAATFFMVEETGIGKEYKFSGEKLSLVAAVYKAKDFDETVEKTKEILNYMGKGHSCGLHTSNDGHAIRVGFEMDVCRLLINQPQCFGNGGSFDNGLNFTLSMGGGTWAGNNIGENLSYKYFMNVTKLSRQIPENVPAEDELFGDYWTKFGK